MASNKYLEQVVTSAARTVTGNSASFDMSRADQVRLYINVTAVTGAPTTFAIELQDTPDGGSTWYNVASTHSPQPTGEPTAVYQSAVTGALASGALATGQYSLDVNATQFGDMGRIRWVLVGGTSPSVTFTVDLLRVEYS